jgi:N-acylneuraminate cytidylyltransferase
VDDAIRILLDHVEADSVRGVVPAGQNPHKMWRISGESGPMKSLLDVPGIEEPYNAPRQILPPIYWQTGHIDAIRTETITKGGSMSGSVIYPILIDPRYAVDIDNLQDWVRYEHLISTGRLDMITPGKPRRPMPEIIKLVICDFDGVITDNRVWTGEDGHETIVASRSDSMRINQMREIGIDVMILSSEPKMGVEAIHGVGLQDKGRVMRELLAQKNVKAEEVVYIGNDWNDLPCFEIAGWAVAVADAYPEVLRAADHVLAKSGGHGAVRELCDLILNRSNHVS